MTETENSADLKKKSTTILFFLTLLLLPTLLYIPAFSPMLIWDSQPIIFENQLLETEFSLSAPFLHSYWETTSQKDEGIYDYYRPIMILSFMAEKALWGISPFRLRLTNLLLFLLSLLILYKLFKRYQKPEGPLITARLAILLFALFPLHLDNILWVVGRCDLLMMLFGVTSILCFDIFLEKHSPMAAVLSLITFILALFSKESALFFLAVFPIHEYIRRRRIKPTLYIAPILLAAGFWILKASLLEKSGFPFRLFSSPLDNLKAFFGGLGYYLKTLVFPFHFDMFLPLTDVTSLIYLLFGSLFFFLLLWIALFKRHNFHLAMCWTWIVPFLGAYLLLIFTPLHPFSISSRYLMIPIIGWCWLLGYGIAKIPKKFQATVFSILLLAFGASLFLQSGRYQSNLAFWKNALKSSPNTSFFLSKTAQEQLNQNNLLESEPLFLRAMTGSMPSKQAAQILLSLAEIRYRMADYPKSHHWLTEVDRLPMHAIQKRKALLLKSSIHLALGQYPEAETPLQEVYTASGNIKDLNRLIRLRMAFDDWNGARDLLKNRSESDYQEIKPEIDRLEKDLPLRTSQQRAVLYQKLGNFSTAWHILNQDETKTEADPIYLIRSAFWAGKEEDAEHLISTLLNSYDPEDIKAFNTIGSLYMEFGRIRKALSFFRRSLEIKPRQPELKKMCENLKSLYPETQVTEPVDKHRK